MDYVEILESCRLHDDVWGLDVGDKAKYAVHYEIEGTPIADVLAKHGFYSPRLRESIRYDGSTPYMKDGYLSYALDGSAIAMSTPDAPLMTTKMVEWGLIAEVV